MPAWLSLAFAVPVALCGLEDLRRRAVPNVFTLPLLAAGLVLGIWQGSWREALLGLAVGAAVGVGAWLSGGLGEGDAKLMMAVGAWLGPVPALRLFAVAALVGVAWGAVRLVRRGLLRERLLRFLRALYLFPSLGLSAFAQGPPGASPGPEDPGSVPFGACLAVVLVPAVVANMV